MTKFAYFLGVLVGMFNLLATPVYAAEKKVQVESPYQYRVNKKGEQELVQAHYRDRRPDWGVRLNFAIASSFETQITQEHPVTGEEAPLESDSTPFHINVGMSKNFKHFSIGPEIGYMTSKLLSRCEHSIEFKGFTFGAGVYLDGVFKSAYVVPFVSVGAILPEITVPTTDDGTCNENGKLDLNAKDFVLYYRAGFLMGLNWIDRMMAHKALSDYGLQNSFLYLAFRQIPSTSDLEAADIGTKPFLEYGLQFEF